MQDNILSFMGIMRKASALGLGAEAVYDAAQTNRAKLVLLAKDISQNTEKSIKNTCNLREIPVLKMPYTKEEMGEATGYAQCGALVILDVGFARSLAEKLKNVPLFELMDEKATREKRRREKKRQILEQINEKRR